MILTFFTIFILLGIILIALGYYTRVPLFNFLGIVFLFGVGVTLLTGYLEIPNGYTSVSTVVDNTTTEVITPAYTTYTNFYLAFFTVIIVIGYTVVLMSEMKGYNPFAKDEDD